MDFPFWVVSGDDVGDNDKVWHNGQSAMGRARVPTIELSSLSQTSGYCPQRHGYEVPRQLVDGWGWEGRPVPGKSLFHFSCITLLDDNAPWSLVGNNEMHIS